MNKQMKENAPQEEKDTATSGMLDTVLSNSSTTFEIVPIIYPTVQTDYVGTSLYVDQVRAPPQSYIQTHILLPWHSWQKPL